jgi:hypothetical protein
MPIPLSANLGAIQPERSKSCFGGLIREKMVSLQKFIEIVNGDAYMIDLEDIQQTSKKVRSAQKVKDTDSQSFLFSRTHYS